MSIKERCFGFLTAVYGQLKLSDGHGMYTISAKRNIYLILKYGLQDVMIQHRTVFYRNFWIHPTWYAYPENTFFKARFPHDFVDKLGLNEDELVIYVTMLTRKRMNNPKLLVKIIL